uniref:G-protein coupled receptors family 1 profile domain-containing protein n=1 Tax=Anopheles albimanus TaxID=7167 RepID=A0A182FLU8_ANOAL
MTPAACGTYANVRVGNALVCIAVYTNHTMRTVTNIFIVNLAVADFFVILFCLPPTVVWDVTETWFMGKAMCKVVIYFQ